MSLWNQYSSFNSKHWLDDSFRLRNRDGSTIEEVMNKEFSDKKDWSRQDTVTLPTKKYHCPDCSYKTDYSGTFNRHKIVHSRKKFACEQCPYIASRWETFQFHKQMHEEPGMFCCTRCDFKSTFLFHLKGHTCSSISCSKCCFKTNSKDTYEKHILSHPSYMPGHKSPVKERSKIFTCNECGFETRAKGSMKLHSLMHTHPPLVCSRCEFTTTFETLLAMHEQSHRMSEPAESSQTKASPPLSSDFVTMKLRQNGRLKPSHERDSINQETSSSLVRGNKVFTCPLCGFIGFDDSKFKEHLSTHDKGHNKVSSTRRSQEKYKCSSCPFYTDSLGVWKRHYLTVHYDKFSRGKKNKKDKDSVKKYMTWPTEDKKEIYWCHVYSKHDVFERVGMAERRRDIMLKRGILNREKVLGSPYSRFQNIAANMKMGRTRVTAEELRKIEQNVEEYVKKHGTDYFGIS